jgi:hypothetical protein
VTARQLAKANDNEKATKFKTLPKILNLQKGLEVKRLLKVHY